VCVSPLRDLLQRVEILADAVADAGSLDFDRDLAAVAEASPVDLAEAGGGDRLVTICSTSAKGNGSTLSCSRVSASRYFSGRRSERVERSWPSLM